MKKLYFHVGAHKSASTTLQRNIKLNKKKLLAEYGISFVGGADLVGSEFLEHFRKLSKGEYSIGCSSYAESLEKAKNSLERMLENIPSNEVLLSWEGVLGHSALDEYQGIYTHSREVADSLCYIVKDYDARVLLIARRQDEFIESCYLQQIKERRTISFDEFAGLISPNALSWLDISLSFERCFGEKFKAIPFEFIKTAGAKKFIQFSLFVLTERNISLDGFEVIEKANPSFSQYGMELARELLPKLSEESKIRVGKMLFNEFGNDKFEKAVFFSKFNRSVLLNMLKRDNAVFFDKYISRHFKENNAEVDKILKSWLGD